ncbi:MAG: PD-(D/E)XK nuclease family protein [Prevotellaceae bacterium]|nr:PD-(D/E)XK nuclease family protein [Prevotellaceae bacterium]
MTPFLQHVAADLLSRFGNNLSELTLVFPGKRASLFMNDHLARLSPSPVWAPRYATLDDIFLSLSPYTQSDPVVSVCLLYGVYAEAVPEPMPLDEFYSWGEILLNDFEDIDKHLVNAEALFANAGDLSRMDSVDFLSESQKEALNRFFHDFDQERQTELKRRFTLMWEAMPRMYRGLQRRLSEQGQMYAGALYRKVVEGLSENPRQELLQRPYAVVGFNVLDEVETALFKAMQRGGNTLFYWDYDDFYLRDERQEAGFFLRQNIRRFGNALERDIYNNLLRPGKRISIVSASSDNAQARYLASLLDGQAQPTDTVVALADETLLQPVLHSIPTASQGTLNITMGYPIKGTPIEAYYLALLDLQANTSDDEAAGLPPSLRQSALNRVRSNPFHAPEDDPSLVYQPSNTALLEWLADRMQALGIRLKSDRTPNTVFSQLYEESVFQLFRLSNQFAKLTKEGILPVSRHTLASLLRQAVQSLSVPFHGDTDKCLQVMGVLETRALDFSRVIMLSVGEGYMPRGAGADPSLIPYCLRDAFGLNTIERKTAVYAYYFYRLLQRAEDITLVYNDNSSGARQNEKSRFLRQLEAETSLSIRHLRLEPPLSLPQAKEVKIEKTPEVYQRLLQHFSIEHGGKYRLSPSALGNYLNCPLLFFYQSVACLEEPQQDEGEIDNALLGTLFHDAAQFFYQHLGSTKGSKLVLEEDIAEGIPFLPSYVDLTLWVDYFRGTEYDAYSRGQAREAFLRPYLEETPSREDFARRVSSLYAQHPAERGKKGIGMCQIVQRVLLRYLGNLLGWDRLHCPFAIEELEKDVSQEISLSTDRMNLRVRVGGRIDRMDRMRDEGGEFLRIVDYKTGRPKAVPADLASLFQQEAKGQERYYLQTLLYCLIARRQEPRLPVRPCLFYITEAKKGADYSPLLKLGTGREAQPLLSLTDEQAEELLRRLTRVTEEIFNPNIPFSQAPADFIACPYCDFRQLCGRG